MFKRPLQKQFIDHGSVHCPRRGRDVESDACASCEWRVEFRPDAKPAFVLCEAERGASLWPRGWHSGW